MKKKSKICFVMIFALCICMIFSFDISSAASKKIRLNKKKISLQNKQKYKLKLKGVKNKKVKWSSNNKKVATVKNGVIDTKRVGKCTITAKYAKKKYKCAVKVEQNETNAMNENSVTNSGSPNPSSTPNAEPTVVQALDEGKVPDYSFSDIDDFSNVVMESQLNMSDKNILALKISNCSGTDITMDNYFVLEFFDNGKWDSVKFKENSYFEEVVLVIGNGTDYVQNINLERYFVGLSKGKYRISKQIAATNQGVIRAEFTID